MVYKRRPCVSRLETWWIKKSWSRSLSQIGAKAFILFTYVCDQEALRDVLPNFESPFFKSADLKYEHFCMESESALPKVLYGSPGFKGCLFALSDSFSIPKVFETNVENRIGNPRIFTKVLEEALDLLRLRSITIIPYLDDLLVVAESHQKLEKALQTFQGFLQSPGWLINMEKCSDSDPESNILGTKFAWWNKRFSFLRQKCWTWLRWLHPCKPTSGFHSEKSEEQ